MLLHWLLLLQLLRLCIAWGRSAAAAESSTSVLSLALSQVLLESEMSECRTLYVHLESSDSDSDGDGDGDNVQSTHLKLLDLLDEVQQRLAASVQLQPLSLSQQGALLYRPYKHAVLLLVSDMQALRRVYATQRATSNLSYTLIYMLQPQPTPAMQLMWQLSVLNVALVTSSRELLLLSYFPFSPTHGCQLIRASVENRFDVERRRWTSRPHFPAKLGNFYGCTLTCATWPDMPYLVLQPDGSFVGIEGALLQFMADNLNFSVGLYWLTQEQVRDTFNDSGWIFEEASSCKADYALGGFHYKPSDGGDGSEVPYSQSMYYFMSHIMLVTNLPSAYSAYEKLAFPFHPQLWRAIGLVLALSYLLVWLLQRRHQRYSQHPYYQLLVLTLGGNLLTAELPRRTSSRLLLVTWLLGTLVLRSAYQSGMYQLLRQDTQRDPPQTIADVLEQRYTIQLVDGNADLWLASLPELRTQQLRHLAASELQSFGQLAASSGSNQRLAIITPYEYFGYYRKVHAMSRRLHLVRERIFTQQLSFNVRRHSHMVGVLNQQIMLAHSHGFLEHWTRQYVSAVDERDESIARITAVQYDTLDGLQPEGDMNGDEQELGQERQLRVLAFAELAALFWLTLWAHLGAALVFALELLIHK
ncbi:hypothetical protein KR093_009527 [Drosophila rubida]|uniref:Putative ionotropic receptor ligand binding domain-containing protein n=1 Tax=Drosophila rubida TaxID=30044 RepID=A0AAD4KC38_9MUSC|nr:hypothetical protein KR093_009527 [Drosophila rubida]